MIPLHITTTEWYGVVVMVVAMLVIVAYISYQAGAMNKPIWVTEEATDSEDTNDG